MISYRYVRGLGFLIFCLAFTMMVSGAAAVTPTNTTHITMNQSANHTTTKLNTITSEIKINTAKPTSSKYNSTINGPQIYKNGIAVARGGHPAGYVFPSIGAAINASLSGDTIMLENGAVFDETNLTITKNIAFNVFQNGQATIDSQSKGQPFFIVGGVNVEITNLKKQLMEELLVMLVP
jgi:hypothetical protein